MLLVATALVASFTLTQALAQSFTTPTLTLPLTGSIAYSPAVSVNVNASKVISTNNLSLAFALGYDWRLWRDSSAMSQLTTDADFKLVHIYDAILEPCTYWDEPTDTGTFSWTSVDLLIQRIFSAGAEPSVALGYIDSSTVTIPLGMAVDPSTGLPYPDSFAAYCRAWVDHMKAMGFPVRYYEVFNEAWYYFYPNFNWNGAKAGYFTELFKTCYDAMHASNSQVLVSNDASLHKKAFDFWIANDVILDYLSFHKYDCDGLTMGDQTPLQRAEQRYYVTDTYFYGVNDARQRYFNARGVTLQAMATETNWAAVCSSGTDPRIQQVVGAVWTALMLKSSVLNGVQHMCYFAWSSSSSWELAHKSSGGYGFGMVNQDNNQPWYPYLVQKMVSDNLAAGDQIVESSSSSSDIRTLTWIHDGTMEILLISRVDESRTIYLQGINGQLSFSKIDDNVPYDTPRLQVGTIGASGNFEINGYSVFLVQTEI
jgi:hypothetical protein